MLSSVNYSPAEREEEVFVQLVGGSVCACMNRVVNWRYGCVGVRVCVVSAKSHQNYYYL